MEKLTDAEIKKALECCSKGRWGCGEECPRFKKGIIKISACRFELLEDALGLINRLQAENEFAKKANSLQMEEMQSLKEKNKVLANELANSLQDAENKQAEIERLQSRKLINADELFTKFAGHSDYHGDTILCIIQCMAERKTVDNARPLDTSKIKSKAYKKFAERLQQEIQESKYRINDSPYARACNQVADWCIEVSDNLLKELTEGCK